MVQHIWQSAIKSCLLPKLSSEANRLILSGQEQTATYLYRFQDRPCRSSVSKTSVVSDEGWHFSPHFSPERERRKHLNKQSFFYPRRLALLCHLTCELSPSLSFCFVCVGKTLKGPAHSRLYNASDPEGTSWEMNPFEMPADYILV